MNKDKQNQVNTGKKVKRMAVSMRPAPVFEGRAAKRLIEMLNSPPDNRDLFKRLEESPKIIKEIKSKSNDRE